MWTQKPGEINYTLSDFGNSQTGTNPNSISTACKTLWTNDGIFAHHFSLIANSIESAKPTFNAMLGIDLGIDFSKNGQDVNSQLMSTDIDRTQRIYNFWNNPKIVNKDGGFSIKEKFIPSGFGLSLIQDFQSQGDDSGSVSETDLGTLQSLNVLVTYLLVLIFESIPSSVDGVNIYNPLNIFTEPTDRVFFCKASDNIRQFVNGTRGLGNFPLFSSPWKNSDIGDFLEKYWNTGYLSKYCSSQYTAFCTNKKIPFTSDKCIQDYRKKMANSPNALNWCGCFTPLPTWVRGIFNINKNIPPNTCDNLCFGSYGLNNVGYYNHPIINNAGSTEDPSTRIQCPSTVCVIGDNSINAVNSKADVNFNQICPGGKNGQITRCYLDVTDPSLLDNVKSGENGLLSQSTFRQDCPEAICYVIDASTGVQRIVKCNSINTPATGGVFKNNTGGLSTTKKYETIYSDFWDFILLIMFLLILFEFAYIEIHRYMQRSKTL